MAAKKFYAGQKLKSVLGAWIESEGVCTYHNVVSHENCKSITVVMEPGLQSLVPWAIVEFNDGSPPNHINLLLMESVTELKESDSYC